MRIGIDISQIVYGTGVSRYISTLIESLVQYDKQNDYIFFFSSLRQKLPVHIKTLIHRRQWQLKEYKLPPTLLNIIWNQWHILPIENFIGKIDIFFSSDWTEPPAKAAKITTIHDLVIYKYPESSHKQIVATHRSKLEWVRKEEQLILCDSKATKQDALELLNIPSSQLEVVYPAVEIIQPEQDEIKKTKKKYHIEKSFILTVGTLQPRKNIQRLIDAFNKAQLLNTELLIVGMNGWGENIKTANNDNIRLIGYVSDTELLSLYNLAQFFVYPSIYEGFGLPIIEAMASGCPVAASNTSSMKEITENYGLLFDPLSTADMTRVIIELNSNPDLRSQLRKKGYKQVQNFSRENFARQLIKIFKELQ